ncbi:MAG: trimethylamine methyltransferase family protein, partial [Thiothrix sp.]|nr:trimethylamine methyltransferase family protein [Thiothrix sp.]
MAQPNRRGRRQRSAQSPKIRFPQLERRTLHNRFAPVAALDEEQVSLIHEASMELLEQQGIEVLGEAGRQVFRDAGVMVGADGMVRLERGLVMESIGKAPSRFTVTPRNPDNALQVGGDVIQFGLVSGPPNVHDAINGRRMGNMADYR